MKRDIMNGLRSNRPPRFLRQGVLILLPVAVLAGVGLFSLREDHAQARHEAAERARVVAEELADNLWTILLTTRGSQPVDGPGFKVSPAGELLNLPGGPAEGELRELSRRLFTAAQTNLTGMANTNRLLAEVTAVRWPRLFWFRAPATRPGTNGPIAFEQEWLAARVKEEPDGMWFICRHASDEEVPLHSRPVIIGGVVVVKMTEGLSNQLAQTHGIFDLRRFPSDPVLAELALWQKRLPKYFGVTLEVAGKTIISSNHLPVITWSGHGKGSGHSWEKSMPDKAPALLASAQKVEDAVKYLRVGVHLISPDILYARQHSRAQLFGLLIAVSALAALVGFVSAWRAFQKQERLSEMKSNFVASVSHELRAPLASVRLLAEGLERGDVRDAAKQEEYFRLIVQECRRLSSLIENVLDFARIEQGRQQYEFEPADPVELIRQTVRLMEPCAAARQITLALALDDAQTSPLDAQPSLDGRALQQALVNLIDNAIKHSPAGATVTIGLGRESAPPRLLFWVEDHGEGIPSAEHERIFERFHRLGSELRRETQGVGIGLSIVRHIVAAHGGQLTVRSAVGEGSRFTIELPVEKSPSIAHQSLSS